MTLENRTESAFLTLTYDDQHLPEGGKTNYRDVQLFLKRLRKTMAKPENGGYNNIRFFACAEYGSIFKRPHYHLIVFGIKFKDAVIVGKSKFGENQWRSTSETLTQVWGKGNAEIGTVTTQSISYCASYVVEKITGKAAKQHYERTNPETGEIYDVPPEMARMSTNPGIGKPFFDKFKDDLWKGNVVHPIDRVTVALPTYFKRKLKELDVERYEALVEEQKQKLAQIDASLEQAGDSRYKIANRKEKLSKINIYRRAMKKQALAEGF